MLEPIDITDKNALFASNILAFVTVHQHAGLAFLMLKRYKDSARILNEVRLSAAALSGTPPGMSKTNYTSCVGFGLVWQHEDGG